MDLGAPYIIRAGKSRLTMLSNLHSNGSFRFS